MRRIRFAIFAILVGFCTAADTASADEAEAWTAAQPTELHRLRYPHERSRRSCPGSAPKDYI
jgi:hypothetical protein